MKISNLGAIIVVAITLFSCTKEKIVDVPATNDMVAGFYKGNFISPTTNRLWSLLIRPDGTLRAYDYYTTANINDTASVQHKAEGVYNFDGKTLSAAMRYITTGNGFWMRGDLTGSNLNGSWGYIVTGTGTGTFNSVK